MISNNDRRLLDVALELSKHSAYPRVKIGAVVGLKGKILGAGVNQVKSHPLQRRYNDRTNRKAKHHNLHAELSAIFGVGSQTEGATIYVARHDLTGKPGLCRPCVACMEAIKEYGIKRIVYMTPDGTAEEYIE